MKNRTCQVKLMKIRIMPVFCVSEPLTNRIYAQIRIVFLIFLLIPVVDGNVCSGVKAQIIIIDPGHGGDDWGAVSMKGDREKDITLDISGRIAEKLHGRYNVFLTRTGDYALGITERAEFANQHQGEVFISIHTAGEFRHSADGITIWFFEGFTGEDGLETDPLFLQDGPKSLPAPWEEIQSLYKGRAQEFAKVMQFCISDDRVWNTRTNIPVRIMSCDLKLLEGISMPGIVVELMNLKNPEEHEIFMSQEARNRLAIMIAQAVRDFFQNH